MLKNNHNKNTGSTLIEVLVAIVIVGVVLTAIAAMLTNTVSNSSQADFRQIATRYAQEKIEEQKQAKAEGWSSFIALYDPNFTSPETLISDDPKATFTRTYDRDVSGNSVTVTVKVEWDDGGETRDVQVEQIFYKY